MLGEWLYYHIQYNQHEALVKTNTSKFNSVIEWIRAKWNVLLSRSPSPTISSFCTTQKSQCILKLFMNKLTLQWDNYKNLLSLVSHTSVVLKCFLDHPYSRTISTGKFAHFLVQLLMDLYPNRFSIPSKSKMIFTSGSEVHTLHHKSG